MQDTQTKKIIADLGIKNLPPDKTEKILEKLEKNIQRNVALEIFDLLNGEDQKELSEIIDSKNDKDISSFLSKRIPLVESLVRAVAESVVREFKNSIK